MKTYKKILILSLCTLMLLLGCADQLSTPIDSETAFELWGSFTPDKTYSYDEKYYALQKVEKNFLYGFDYIKVSIYETGTDALISSFYPARSFDFWGICWENDTYNIWIQSGDIGVYCYKCENTQWEINYSAKRPDYIISKYDKYNFSEGND